MKKKPPPEPPKPIEWTRADPVALANFNPATKRCVMNCGPASTDPRSRSERLFLCDECEAVRCECHACIAEHDLKAPNFGAPFFDTLPLSASKMILCPLCGNKRCPKASDHRNQCTRSNAPGQPGSVYEATQ